MWWKGARYGEKVRSFPTCRMTSVLVAANSARGERAPDPHDLAGLPRPRLIDDGPAAAKALEDRREDRQADRLAGDGDKIDDEDDADWWREDEQ